MLFFFQGISGGLWIVTFSNVLRAHGLEKILPYAFSCSAIAALISPLIAGALADQHFSAARLLRWFTYGSAGFLLLTFAAITRGWGPVPVLVLLQIYALFSAPCTSLVTVIGMAGLRDPAREYGRIRVWATLGWMSAGWGISCLYAENSSLTGFLAAGSGLLTIMLTFWLPQVQPAIPAAGRRWRALLGLDALGLLRQREHRAIFITNALVNIPLAAFLPFAALQLQELGKTRVAASMTLGQISEIVAMFALGTLIHRVSLRWLLLGGIGFGVIRYAFFTQNSIPWLLVGIALHGLVYTLTFVTAQIYIERRIERGFQARAQALLNLMSAGVGTLLGALGCGWWHQACKGANGTDWTLFWGVLCAALFAIWIYFALSYRGGGIRPVESGRSGSAAGVPLEAV